MPSEMQRSWEDGIRSLRPDELDKLEEFLGAVFRPSLVGDCPHLYTGDNAANLRVMVRNGKLVSHMGTLRRYACLGGCTVRVACLGGVATLEEHRGQGYATALLDDALLAGGGRAAEVLEAVFPIPSLWYGLNYA